MKGIILAGGAGTHDSYAKAQILIKKSH